MLDLIIVLDAQAFSRRLPWHPQGVGPSPKPTAVRGLADKVYARVIRFYFPGPSFCPGGISGLFLGDRLIIGVSVIFRHVHIMVATSVK